MTGVWWTPWLIFAWVLVRLCYGVFTETGPTQVLSFATHGIGVYLAFFVSALLSFVLKKESSVTGRRVAWAVVALLVSGLAGQWLNDERGVDAVDVMEPAQEHDPQIDVECRDARYLAAVQCVRRVQNRPWMPLFTLSRDQPFEQTVAFTAFPEPMLPYLQRAAAGEARLLVEPYVFRDPQPQEARVAGGADALAPDERSKYVLSPAQVAEFMRARAIVFTTQVPPGTTVPITAREFRMRNHRYPVHSRHDSARFAGQPFTPPLGDTFLVTFQFETPDHVPLALFY